jgi:hypothetical protein
MSEAVIDTAINAHISSILLRYFRRAFAVQIDAPRLDLVRDMEMLRMHWSISPALNKLTGYILAHRHESQSFLAFQTRVEDGAVRGRLDARATMIKRLVTGHPSVTVAQEPVRSFASGPNHVMAWVLQQAWLLSGQFLHMLADQQTGYRLAVETSTLALEQVRKIESIRTTMSEANLARRPGGGALQQAARSRRLMHRLAYDAFMELAAIEAGDADAISRMLQATLLGPMEEWRRFELAVGLGLAQALEAAIGLPAVLSVLRGEGKTPVARIGRFAIFWQSQSDFYDKPPPEPSEIIVRGILDAYGLSESSDRPDLIVADMLSSQVVAVVEVKFFAGAAEDTYDRVRGATAQVVRYARGYRDIADIAGLLGSSVIALIRNAIPMPALRPPGVPLIVDFEDIRQGQLAGWAKALAAPRHPPPEIQPQH